MSTKEISNVFKKFTKQILLATKAEIVYINSLETDLEKIDPKNIEMAISFLDMIDSEVIIHKFIRNCFVNEIKDEDDDLWILFSKKLLNDKYIEDSKLINKIFDIYPSIPSIEKIKSIFSYIDQENRSLTRPKTKKTVLVILESLIKTAIKYIFYKREPFEVKKSDSTIICYRNDYMTLYDEKREYIKIDLNKYASIYKVDLKV